MKAIRTFLGDQRGTTAVIFGLSVLPILGLAGAAVDWTRAVHARTALQRAADSTALAMVAAAGKGSTLPDYKAVLANHLGPNADVGALAIAGDWEVPGSQFRVEVTTKVTSTLFSVFRPHTDVGARATAQLMRTVTKVDVEGVNLSPEAADYNELNAYCYNETTGQRLGPLDPKDATKRLPFLKIADNTDAGVAAKPQNLSVTCADGEEVSYHLKNVRNARTNPALRATGETWNHYTDTTVLKSGPNKGVPQYNTLYKDLIETIMCSTKDECRPKAEGGKLPNNNQTGRTPAVTKEACLPGKYIYFGWEDRPPNLKDPVTKKDMWTDQDYDDIRFVMRCPETKPGPMNIRLVS